MTHLKIDVPPDEIIEMPVIPTGTVVTLQICGEPEIKESSNNPGESYLNIPLEVIKADDQTHVGCSLFFMAFPPSTIKKKRMLRENKTKGWKMCLDGWARFCSVFNVDKVDIDTQRLIGKKFKATLKTEEYDGRISNKVGQILERA